MVPNGWSEGRVGDLLDGLESGVSVNGEDRHFSSNEKAVLKVSAVTYGSFNPFAAKVIDIEELDRATTNPKQGQVIISRSNTESLVGASAYIERDYPNLFLPDKLWQTVPKANADMKWLSYILASSHVRYMLSNLATGTSGSMKNITKGELLGLKILIPPSVEQKKISQTLSTWDKAISTAEQLLTNSQQQKKALMQQLLTGKKRLRDNNGVRFSGEWQQCIIEDFFDVGSSKRVLQDDWKNEGTPFYRTRELVSLSKNEPFRSEVFIADELFHELSIKYGAPKPGDFLVSGVGTLGISYQVKDGDRFYFKDGNVLWFKIKEGLFSDYFKYCFQSDFLQEQIVAQASITTVGTYTIQNAKKTKFWCPPSIAEQQKIAAVLSTADQEIAALQQKLDALKQEKMALMQQLLTGKKRVIV